MRSIMHNSIVIEVPRLLKALSFATEPQNMMIWPVMLTVDKSALTTADYQHEGIHGAQQVEFLTTGVLLSAVSLWFTGSLWALMGILIGYLMFYLWYALEWLVRWLMSIRQPNAMEDAYYSLSFEREAYNNHSNPSYLEMRTPFAWVSYLWKE